MKFHENLSKGSGDMERTRNSRVNPLTLSLGSWVICFAHRLTKSKIWAKFHENLSMALGDVERT